MSEEEERARFITGRKGKVHHRSQWVKANNNNYQNTTKEINKK